ncbi:hypothetical protein [Prochlorococcus marinus]|uniref:hypothetical protein n=1 Tax=Prochlorococcus marinus TaxID=1219 RepID=UPI0022B54D7F|nr:hypothetical protein [Prochlorococcus marinus]
MDKTTTWLVRVAATVVIGAGIMFSLGFLSKLPFGFGSSKPSTRDMAYQEIKRKYDAALARSEKMMDLYQLSGKKEHCNASFFSILKVGRYALEMGEYMNWQGLERSKKDEINQQITEAEKTRLRVCRDAF